MKAAGSTTLAGAAAFKLFGNLTLLGILGSLAGMVLSFGGAWLLLGTVVVILPDRGDRYLSTTLFRSVCASCPL